MRVLLLCLLALGVQATYLDDWDDPEKDVGRQNGMLKRKHRKLSPNKNKKKIIKVNNEIKQYDSRETFFDNVIPEPQEYIPPRGKQKVLKSPVKNKKGKTKVNSGIKQYDNREEFSDNVGIPEPQEYVPPRGKQKLSKLSAFSTASVAQGVQFIADIVAIASSDFWKWMKDVG